MPNLLTKFLLNQKMIPPTLNYFWNSSIRDMNELELFSLAEAVRISGLKVILHTDKPFDMSGVEIRPTNFPRYHNGKPIKHIEHSVDMVRFETAVREGGFYSDTDIVLFKPLVELIDLVHELDKNEIFAYQNKAYKTICIGFFACSPGNDIITRAYKAYLDGYPGKTYHSLASFKKLVPTILQEQVFILEQTQLFPVRMNDPTFYSEPYSETDKRKWGYGCHLWMHVIDKDCVSLVVGKLKREKKI